MTQPLFKIQIQEVFDFSHFSVRQLADFIGFKREFPMES